MMKLVVNGQSVETPEECRSIADLLEEPQWKGRMVIVELNGLVLFGDQFEETLLSDGDKIELVHFVGGG